MDEIVLLQQERTPSKHPPAGQIECKMKTHIFYVFRGLPILQKKSMTMFPRTISGILIVLHRGIDGLDLLLNHVVYSEHSYAFNYITRMEFFDCLMYRESRLKSNPHPSVPILNYSSLLSWNVQVHRNTQ